MCSTKPIAHFPYGVGEQNVSAATEETRAVIVEKRRKEECILR